MKNNKEKKFKLFFSYSFQIDQIYSSMHFAYYKRYILNFQTVFFEVNNHILYSSFNIDNFFRYDLYVMKLFDMSWRISDTKFFTYIYDGITEYSDLYLKAINYFHQTGFKMPIWVFSRNQNMKYKELFSIVPDDTTFGNIRRTITVFTPSHYGIIISGFVSSIVNVTSKTTIFVQKLDKGYVKLGHVLSLHDKMTSSPLFSSRYILFNNNKNEIDNFIKKGFLQKINKYKYQVILDGVGATYPGYISKLASSTILIKILDNDNSSEYNIVWEQWFYPILNQKIDLIPIYIRNLLNIYYIKNINVDTFLHHKKYLNIILDEYSIDEYFIFMIQRWNQHLKINIQNDDRFIENEHLKTAPFFSDSYFLNYTLFTEEEFKIENEFFSKEVYNYLDDFTS